MEAPKHTQPVRESYDVVRSFRRGMAHSDAAIFRDNITVPSLFFGVSLFSHGVYVAVYLDLVAGAVLREVRQALGQ